MRLPSAQARRVLLLQRAAVIVFVLSCSVRYLHTFDTRLGITPAAAAWAGGEHARRAGEGLRALALEISTDTATSGRHDRRCSL